MFGLPIVFHIDKDYVGAFAALGGVLLGFVLENYRNKKTERKEIRKILISISTQINALAFSLFDDIVTFTQSSNFEIINDQKIKFIDEGKLLIGRKYYRIFLNSYL